MRTPVRSSLFQHVNFEQKCDKKWNWFLAQFEDWSKRGITRRYYSFLWNASHVGVELCTNSDSYAKQDSKRYHYIITEDFPLICLDYFLSYSQFCLKLLFQVLVWPVTELLLIHKSENIQETKKDFSKCYWLSRSHWINVPFLLFAITFCILTILM